MSEIWKDIPGFECYYQVSNIGNIRSVDREVPSKNGSIYRLRGLPLKHKISKYGYHCITLKKSGKCHHLSVHNLVLLAFVGVKPDKYQGCHNDGDKDNNHVGNLRYDTVAANHKDKIKHNTQAKGSGINTSKLIESEVIEMRVRRFNGECVKSLSERFGISTTGVSKICIGDNWKYAGGPIVDRLPRVMSKA